MRVFNFDLNGTSYRIDARNDYPAYNGGYSWTAYRKQPNGTFDKIPCSSRAEEHAFPKAVAWVATLGEPLERLRWIAFRRHMDLREIEAVRKFSVDKNSS